MLGESQFKDALVKLLDAWSTQYKCPPANILYYRDGVSSSQYSELINRELSVFKLAFKEAAKHPSVLLHKNKFNLIKVTTVIVTKRHNTRFFPTNLADAMKGNGNCFPGTLVDSAVTSPYNGDFYLQTQNAIKGTARPCHYFVLKNEMKIPLTQLQELVRLSHVLVINPH